jgi:hypothetical protein
MVKVASIFNPAIKTGTKITVQSELTPACGSWVAFHVIHEIESNIPKGKWLTEIEAASLLTPVTPSD